jgi:hypothetical protein
VAAGLSLAELQSFPGSQDRSPLNITLVLLQTLPLAFRRRAPFTVFAIAAVAPAVQGSLELRGPLFAFLAFNLAVYSLGGCPEFRGTLVAAPMVIRPLPPPPDPRATR